jgi:DNA-binding IclR family transcriptional regulator
MTDPALVSQREFESVNFAMARFHIHHMRRIASFLKMDFESAYIWGTLAILNLVARMSSLIALDACAADTGDPSVPLTPVRLTDLAMICGIPIETVRRKLKKLQQRSKVEQADDGMWYIVNQSFDKATLQFTYESVAEFRRTAELLDRLIDKTRLQAC